MSFGLVLAPLRTSASSVVETVQIPIVDADPNNYEGRFLSCPSSFSYTACIEATADGGALIFTRDLIHVTPTGESQVIDTRAFASVVAASDGTFWADWTEPCYGCLETTLFHLDKDGHTIASFPLRELVPTIVNNAGTELLSADSSGVWLTAHADLFLGYVSNEGAVTPNLFPKGAGRQVG